MKKSIVTCLSCQKDFSYSLYGTICPNCGRDQGLPESTGKVKATLPPRPSLLEDNEEFQRLQAVVTRALGNAQANDNLAQQAIHLVYGPRREAYGDPKSSFEKTALIFNALTGSSLSGVDIVKVLKILKMVRQETLPKEDNLIDQIGYLLLEHELGE